MSVAGTIPVLPTLGFDLRHDVNFLLVLCRCCGDDDQERVAVQAQRGYDHAGRPLPLMGLLVYRSQSCLRMRHCLQYICVLFGASTKQDGILKTVDSAHGHPGVSEMDHI